MRLLHAAHEIQDRLQRDAFAMTPARIFFHERTFRERERADRINQAAAVSAAIALAFGESKAMETL